MVRPAAQKRPRAHESSDSAHQAVRRLFTAGATVDGGGDQPLPDGGGVGDPLTTVHADAHPLATTADPSTMSGTDAETAGASGTGIERPVPEWVDLNQSLHRIVAFIDVCGFTRFTDQYGAHSAIEMLTRFRSACRDVTARRGTRVAKWMGDGVMLVGAEAGPVVATAAELLLRVEDEGFDIHGGIAAGMMLLFEGDDYIGRPVNLAARLCEAAAPGELLAVGVRDAIPEWVDEVGRVTVQATGVGDVAGVSQLRVPSDAWAPTPTSQRHPSLRVVDEGGASRV